MDSNGLFIAAYQWGEDNDPPLLLAHGGFDFAGTLDGFAPRLAAGGWRVISWDQRGHGDSEHAALYNWEADQRDAVAVLKSVTNNAVPVVGHSKGGGVMMALADVRPDLVSALVNLDGLPSKRTMPDVADRDRTRLMAADLIQRLDYRHHAHEAVRKPGTVEELAKRRARMNPRLDHDWLKYLVSVGAQESEDGWRWKLDPTMRFGGFGPYRPEWSLFRLPGLAVPFLGILGGVQEDMGWGTERVDVEQWLPHGGRLEVIDDVGHFVHIERPDHITAMTLEFLA